MRWFKHISTSSQDEKLSKALDLLGIEGYGFWWRMLEVVAERLTTDETSVTLPVKTFANFFLISEKKFLNFVETFTQLELITSKVQVENKKYSAKNKIKQQIFVTIDVPNILKYRDEWTKKQAKNSGVTPELLRNQSGVTPSPESETELRINNISKGGDNIKNININISSPNPPLTDNFSSEIIQENQKVSQEEKKSVPPIDTLEHSQEQKIEKPQRQPSGYFNQLRTVYNRYKNEGSMVGWQEFRIYEKDKSNPDVLSLIEDIEDRSDTDQWRKGYIPSLAKYLKEKLWEQPLEELQDFKKTNEPEDFVAYRKRLEEKAKCKSQNFKT